ncbi:MULTISPECIES: DUF2631 domain-containing protein [Nocardia]|uniref:DUF2631 domain-containing protein n=2 Tax=Nocardia farcinica TaxID=37329 RepID=Q5YS71_NOCFA|nr:MULTISPECIES: DUF2631 domain-containing protein [Nocardia]SLH97128.1 Protein of uncharacterised function (DUF2631) [Mycobacteroides abscessus subsp. abscessus]MCZ9328381.1 DUF2631 domain-containing protein [Nocardia farcinica]PFX00559.1 hypothetical protein CJ469_04381 [Nocardia farcinica]PFX08112.1 hypothetical protein CJ468_02996 [Nocardia farcinica]UEX21477.1 DUF2631 domain-containing protein [Nocardia farcinica]
MAATDIEPAHTERAVVTHVDTAEVPSAEWGWSGEAPRTFKAAGIIVALILLAMIIGNHHGNIENIFLVGFALAIFAIIGYDWIYRRKPR